MTQLRHYQRKAIDDIRALYGRGERKVLLHLSTGGGKTRIFCEILKLARERGTPAIMVVNGIMLIEQASKRLAEMNIPHGIMQGNNPKYDPSQLIQVCSITTLYRRKIVPKARIIVIDEAHQASSDGYMWLTEALPDAYFLAVTATPWVKRGLRHVANVIVKPISIKRLIDDGFLVPAREFAIESSLSLKNISISRGDYQIKELEEEVSKSRYLADVTRFYKKYGEQRPTLLFAVSVAHSRKLVARLIEAGIPSAHIDANTNKTDREAVIDQLQTGRIKVVSSVGVLTTGVDIPMVSCLILARPTKSYNLYIQMVGRGTRPAPGKKDFIVIDLANNIAEHGTILGEPEVNLDGSKGEGVPKPYICKECFCAFFRAETNVCPECGTEVPKPPPREGPEYVELEEEAVEVDAHKLASILMMVAKRKNYKSGWVYYRIREKFGEDIAKAVCRKKA